MKGGRGGALSPELCPGYSTKLLEGEIQHLEKEEENGYMGEWALQKKRHLRTRSLPTSQKFKVELWKLILIPNTNYRDRHKQREVYSGKSKEVLQCVVRQMIMNKMMPKGEHNLATSSDSHGSLVSLRMWRRLLL
ncbi:MAG: hypothetical protein GY852_10640 [bacterium]|nr:hypothetical protein [bacterium]